MNTNILKKLFKIQQDLKVSKSNKNKFGNYSYRSCEDILEKVKPLLKANTCVLSLSDEVVCVGEKNYIKSTVTIIEVHSGESYSCEAMAREATIQKGMQDAQVTGSTSSYARKYALNGLFALDDTKDLDGEENKK